MNREFEEWLEDLGPRDLERDLSAELKTFESEIPAAADQFREHLDYLRKLSARQVTLPDDAYFAATRAKISSRVQIRPVSLRARLSAMLIPAPLLRPLPRVLAGSVMIVVLLLILLLQPLGQSPQLTGQQRYHDLIERFSFDGEVLTRAPLAALLQTDDLQRLFRSAAMLTSPSSLSRSWSLGVGQR
ncbi:MAG: hypothetical protein ABIJ61_04005 [bacterium]